MIERARNFLWLNARTLEQRWFEHAFDGGSAQAVVQAVLAYRNDDGGYGHALEPDHRGPTSQPLHALRALQMFVEVNAPEPAEPVLAWLEKTCPDGSVPFGMSTSKGHPMAPWVTADDRGGLLLTAQIAAALHALKITHPWLDRATAYCWQQVEALGRTHPYELRAAVMFLDEVPDRARAEPAAAKLGHLEQSTEGYAEGEGLHPHEYARTPTGLARRWFTDDELSEDLDELERGQQEDGGWTVAFPAFTPIARYEWRSIATVEALLALRRHGRIS
ncbi:hypothetical protein SAMN05216188_12554 [Lentzea xinjiangensis]|uniref:Prenyltransferase and squalene oxidase repeat-containing protein n=1 Tax=Lentzea xinjiangensis TaxID=402600 RepID=A0A1H9VA94_9PSEU|nr:hypothetical protein [Lentzea xinjiangensis]SES18509.1 hypothetical protein SAMN05216188_12554 [Lentzea xinjiangensis]